MTMYFGDEDKPSLESLVLEHHGVPGMMWGVRRDRELEYHKSIAQGKGSRRQRLGYAVHVAPVHLMIKHKGDINAVAAERAAKLQAQKDRSEAGKATVRDNVRNLRKTTQLTPLQLITGGKVKNLTKS